MKDRVVLEDGLIPLEDEDGSEVDFEVMARVFRKGKEYLLLTEPEEDENGVMVFEITREEPGDMEVLNPVEDDDENEDVYYTYLAYSEEYEYGPAK
ncbi:MAG: DUF1292 domain-containing protein [Clostridia bacterium]|nr:DUF1292 domain-containing protein [Clostridia bacterium]